ncbi:MAG: dihydropteroate synthase [Gammaproteobacteria bacterium]|nr:dihydropteroate synthase [Gammaproteobacteria bacterium]
MTACKSLTCAGRVLDLTTPQVMGILNVTPDSFSDGGLFVSREKALAQVRQMVREGASIIDVGGESTRPGANAVGVQEELDRVLPIVEAIAQTVGVTVSIDTSKARVMRETVKAGAGLINDVRALREPDAMAAAVDANVPVCLMHMTGEPRTMQENPRYENVVREVKVFLAERIACCERAGIATENILVDPGFGFGKSVANNLSLVKHLAEFTELGKPLLMGVSRKSTIGTVLGRPVNDRLFGSVALAALSYHSGASIIRTHDVAATMDVLRMCQAVRRAD